MGQLSKLTLAELRHLVDSTWVHNNEGLSILIFVSYELQRRGTAEADRLRTEVEKRISIGRNSQALLTASAKAITSTPRLGAAGDIEPSAFPYLFALAAIALAIKLTVEQQYLGLFYVVWLSVIFLHGQLADIARAVYEFKSPITVRRERIALAKRQKEEREAKLLEQWKNAQSKSVAVQPSDSRSWWQKYAAYLRSPEWQEVRLRVMERDSWTCQRCGKEATQVHHTRYTWAHRRGDFRRQPMWNMIAICYSCHKAVHTKRRDDEDHDEEEEEEDDDN